MHFCKAGKSQVDGGRRKEKVGGLQDSWLVACFALWAGERGGKEYGFKRLLNRRSPIADAFWREEKKKAERDKYGRPPSERARGAWAQVTAAGYFQKSLREKV